MFIDFRELDDQTTINADICIIGAGAAGISLAREFKNTQTKVCLLESGGFEFDPAIQSLYDLKSVGMNGRGLKSSRMRYFGGATNIWVGWCAPFLEIDFEKRDWVPYSGWPIDKQTLDPFYERAHEVCQLGPYRYDLASLARNKSDFPDYDKQKLATRFWQFSPPPPTRFGVVYREDLESSDNISVYLYANVTKLQTDETAARIKTVSIETLVGKKGNVQAKYFVLACGGIENSRLLLLSNDIQKEGLANGNDVIGRYFMRHLEFETADAILDDPEEWLFMACKFRNKQYRLRAGMSPSQDAQRRHRILDYGAVLRGIRGDDSGSWAYQQLRRDIAKGQWPDDFGHKLWTVITDLDDVMASMFNKASENGLEGCENFQSFTLSSLTEQAPNPDSRIYLDSEKDRLGYRKSIIDWRLRDLEKRTIKVANTLIAEEFGRLGIGRIKLPEWLLDDGDGWPDSLWGGFHLMGGTRMSNDARLGVVNSDCKAHGIDNLFIAGSSVFATSSYVNPTLTIVALTLRLADHIKQKV